MKHGDACFHSGSLVLETLIFPIFEGSSSMSPLGFEAFLFFPTLVTATAKSLLGDRLTRSPLPVHPMLPPSQSRAFILHSQL